MRAGEHDLVGAPPRPRDEARRDFARDLGVRDRLAAQAPLGERRRDCGAPTSVTSQSAAKSRTSARV